MKAYQVVITKFAGSEKFEVDSKFFSDIEDARNFAKTKAPEYVYTHSTGEEVYKSPVRQNEFAGLVETEDGSTTHYYMGNIVKIEIS
ncbi:MAG: hypothetical protein JETCAE01_33470 [Anaerolineaceae bacterium]|nr:MAG: hypothetical protein JETCAE01_33470 [Anaerolineaceae bacterium]